MKSEKIIFALLLLLASIPGLAADIETANPSETGGVSSPSAVPSYFEGVWTGKWPWGADGVEITITVGKKYKNGLFGTSYTWGMGRLRNGYLIKSGTLKAWGKEQGEELLIEWKNKEGVKTRITLAKGKENSVKATYDPDGPAPVNDLSDRTTYLTRK